MSKKILLAGVVIAALAPAAAFAQSGGAAAGAATGAVGGAIVGGPVGAAVGGVTGAIVGGIADQQQPEFRQYVTTQKVPSYTYREEVRVGLSRGSRPVQGEGLSLYGGQRHPRSGRAGQPQDRADHPLTIKDPGLSLWAASRPPISFWAIGRRSGSCAHKGFTKQFSRAWNKTAGFSVMLPTGHAEKECRQP